MKRLPNHDPDVIIIRCLWWHTPHCFPRQLHIPFQRDARIQSKAWPNDTTNISIRFPLPFVFFRDATQYPTRQHRQFIYPLIALPRRSEVPLSLRVRPHQDTLVLTPQNLKLFLVTISMPDVFIPGKYLPCFLRKFV